tara:strand:+ start:3458 stop:6571 length:3114 start_codon:yes stop_codon:yes gene_type:complete
MALNEQMKEAIQADIADESSKKERLAKQVEGLKSTGKFIGETAVESVPGVSEAIAAKNVSRDIKEGDYVGAGIETIAGLAGLAPAGGDVLAKGLRKFNKTRKAYKLFVKGEDNKLYPLFVDADKEIKQGEFLEANFPDVAFKGKRSATSKESFYVPTKGAKRSKGEKRKKTGTDIIIPDEKTRQKLINAGFITERAGRTKEAPFGKVTAVAARPGFHASQSPVATHLGPEDLKITKKEADKLIKAGVTPEAIIRKGNQLSVKRRAEDQVFAEVDMADDVDYQSMLAKEGKTDINDYVPKGGSYRYSDGQADSDQWVVGGDMKVNRVLSREEARAIQKEMGVTDLPYRDEVESILGKKFAEGGMVMDDYLVAKTMDQTQDFAKGGMSKQMEIFEPVERGFDDGGLMQEGGSVDPESGNEVPVGSTQEEVRDDIPAQLSEGEFVFPADVVRYIGLENLMRMRQEAKMGLAQMEAMGQMGNSEEATMPDDLPFDMYDLEVEDDGVQDFAQGGVVQAQVGTFVPPNLGTNAGVYYTPSTMQNQTGVSTTPQAAASSLYQPPTQYTPPTQQFVPTTTQTAPSAKEFLKGDEAASRVETIINPDTGEEKQITFIPGVTQIPEGFMLKRDYQPEEKVTSQTSRTQSTGVIQNDDDDDGSSPSSTGGSIAFGGNLNKKGNVDNAIRGDLSFRGANAFAPGLGKFADLPGMFARTRSAAKNAFTGGKFGQPMTLKEGESAIISNMVQSRPGVNRSSPLAAGVSLELPSSFYNKYVSGSKVTQRKTMEEIANYLDKNYKGLGEGSIINAEQILNEINNEKKQADMAEKVAEAQRKAEDARQIADEQARQDALDKAFGKYVGDASSTGYTPGSVIDTAIKDAQQYMSDSDDSDDFGSDSGGSIYDGGSYDPTGGAGYGTGTDCLTEKMKVKLNGMVDFVTNVKVGDIIDSFRVKEVIHKHMRNGYFVINNELEITNDHPVLANGTWTKPEELHVGDYINHVKVESIKYIDRVTPTVSIIVDGDSFNVYTENNTYTVHGRYKEVRQQAA